MVQDSMSFISLWAGRIEPPGNLPQHLGKLYTSVGRSTFKREPEVCEERELVPVVELLEPFSLGEPFVRRALAEAERKRLHVANTVVAVYTEDAPKTESTEPAGCALRFIGTFPDA